MAEITLEESWRQIPTLTDWAEQAMADGRPDEAAGRWRAVLAHPCAHHQVAAYEILDEVHRAFRGAGHYEDVIAAKREAIAAGYRSVPDPEADIAECLLAAGEIEEADALFATLRERDPEDVGLYNSAAYSCAGIDVAASLRWALAGIEVALATGDPDQVVMQLPEALARLDAGFGPEPSTRLPGPVTLDIGWFPADQWPEACRRWPDLLDDLPADHLDYSHATDARIKRISRHAPGAPAARHGADRRRPLSVRRGVWQRPR